MKRKLSKRQMAVAIAKDVIAQLKLKKYIAETGVYVSQEQFVPGDLQKQLRKRSFQPCEVCALGSLFLSKARLFNDVILEKPIERDYDIVPALADYFSRLELLDIENAFERSLGWRPCQRLSKLMHEIDNAADRLTYLMQEIILQKGRFDIHKADTRAGKTLKSFE